MCCAVFPMRVWSHAVYLAKLQAERRLNCARLLATGRPSNHGFTPALGVPRDFAYCLDQRASMALVRGSIAPATRKYLPSRIIFIDRNSERIFVVYSRSLRGLFKKFSAFTSSKNPVSQIQASPQRDRLTVYCNLFTCLYTTIEIV